MKPLVNIALLTCAALALNACYVPKKDQDLDQTLMQYEQIIRWSEWDGAVNMLAPEYLEAHPITNLDMERLRLFQVTKYTVRSGAPTADGDTYQQVVELRFFNKTRATEKVVMDNQLWKYDEESERWLLHSGLPDVTQRY